MSLRQAAQQLKGRVASLQHQQQRLAGALPLHPLPLALHGVCLSEHKGCLTRGAAGAAGEPGASPFVSLLPVRRAGQGREGGRQPRRGPPANNPPFRAGSLQASTAGIVSFGSLPWRAGLLCQDPLGAHLSVKQRCRAIFSSSGPIRLAKLCCWPPSPMCPAMEAGLPTRCPRQPGSALARTEQCGRPIAEQHSARR